jgi:CRISPR system Cascade subunit CasA
MVSFNVLAEPWIPVIDKQGRKLELGILDVLEQASQLVKITDPSPLLKYGIYRLLVAFLTDALRLKTKNELGELKKQGCFPMDHIRRYVEKCEYDGPCFDLFDKDRPFLQSAYSKDLDESKKTSVAKLFHELPSGNNAVHFEHSFQDNHCISAKVCLKALCAVNLFCTPGRQGPSGVNGAPPWYVLITGKNLFESLVFSMWIPSNIEIAFDDPPIAWCNSAIVQPWSPIATISYLYGLTWQSRRVCLIAAESGGVCTFTGEKTNVLVREIYFQAGWKFEGYDHWYDPHVAYQFSDGKKSEGKRSSLKPHEGRAAWRSLGSILFSYSSDASFQCPAIITQYNAMVKGGYWRGEGIIRTELFGIATDQAALNGWQNDRFEIDLKVIQNKQKALWLQGVLAKAEEMNKILRKSLHRIPPQHGKKKANQKWFFDEMITQAEIQFFSAVRSFFFEKIIPKITAVDTNGNGDEKYRWREKMNTIWDKFLEKQLWEVFNQITNGIGLSAKNLEKRVVAAKSLSGNLYNLKKGGG